MSSLSIAGKEPVSSFCYSEAQFLKLYQKSTCSIFEGAAATVFSEEGHIPELLSGKGAIQFPVNSIYVKQKSSQLRPRGQPNPKIGSKSRVDDDWTEVRQKPTKSPSGEEPDLVSPDPIAIQPSSMNLFSQAPDSFFHDEDSPVRVTSPAVTVKVAASDLSLNAPSFTPMSEDRREGGFLDALRTHMSSLSQQSGSLPPQYSWTYLDPNKQVQGPFTGEQMSEWFGAGYFPKDLPVAWKLGEEPPSEFFPLNTVYSGDAPFLSPPMVTARTEAPSVHTSPPRARGWLWSPEEDAKLAAKEQAFSLNEIMNLEAQNGRKK